MDVEKLKKDSQNRELFSKALEESGLYLEWASPEIQNDKVDKNGKTCAFIQGQTYTTYSKITSSTKTSQL